MAIEHIREYVERPWCSISGDCCFVFIVTIYLLGSFFMVLFLPGPQNTPNFRMKSTTVANFQVSPNKDFVTADWNLTFHLNNEDRRYSYVYKDIRANMIDVQGSRISTGHPPFSQDAHSEADIVLMFQNVSMPIVKWMDANLREDGRARCTVKFDTSMVLKIAYHGGSKSIIPCTKLYAKCVKDSIGFSLNDRLEEPAIIFYDNKYCRSFFNCNIFR